MSSGGFWKIFLKGSRNERIIIKNNKEAYKKKKRRKSRGVTFGPEPSNTIVLFSVLQVLCGDATDERIGGIAVRQ